MKFSELKKLKKGNRILVNKSYFSEVHKVKDPVSKSKRTMIVKSVMIEEFWRGVYTENEIHVHLKYIKKQIT